MFVAEQLGMSLTEVGKMSVEELIQWIAYFELKQEKEKHANSKIKHRHSR